MEPEETNLGNPLNSRNDLVTPVRPHVTPMPVEAGAEDLFDDSAENATGDVRAKRTEDSAAVSTRDQRQNLRIGRQH